MEKLREPVIILRNSTHGIALHKTGLITPYSYFDRIICTGSSATLHPNGQIDMHGTPSENGTFQLAGHWLESKGVDIRLSDPSKKQRSLVWDWLRSIISCWEGGEVYLHTPGTELLPVERVISFGTVLITRDYGSTTHVYPLSEISYSAERRFRVREILTGNFPKVAVSP